MEQIRCLCKTAEKVWVFYPHPPRVWRPCFFVNYSSKSVWRLLTTCDWLHNFSQLLLIWVLAFSVKFTVTKNMLHSHVILVSSQKQLVKSSKFIFVDKGADIHQKIKLWVWPPKPFVSGQSGDGLESDLKLTLTYWIVHSWIAWHFLYFTYILLFVFDEIHPAFFHLIWI